MNDDNSERRTSSADIRDIARCYHALDTRVAVLETRIDGQDQRLGTIEADIREIKSGIGRVLEALGEHTRQEDRDRVKLMAAVVATLLSVLGFFGVTLFEHFFQK